MTAFSDNFVKRNDKVFTAVTPCQPLHWSHFSDWEPRTLRNSRVNTECLFRSRRLADLQPIVGNGIVSAHQRTQTLSSYFPTVRTLLFRGWQLYTFSPLLRSFFRLIEKAFQHTAKKSCLTIFPNSCTSLGSNHSCSTEGVPAPPAYPPPQHIKGTGEENQKPEHLGEWLVQNKWKIGDHKWCWSF